MLNLFLFSFICNQLFFITQHIGFGVALHAGWNLAKFSRYYFPSHDLQKIEQITEGDTFNMFEGSLLITLILFFYFHIIVFLLKK